MHKDELDVSFENTFNHNLYHKGDVVEYRCKSEFGIMMLLKKGYGYEH
jgi:hypothetical protein